MRSLVQVQDGPFDVGGIAQLVERLLCKQDVSGSSPLTSTDQPPYAPGRLFGCDLDCSNELNLASYHSFKYDMFDLYDMTLGSL